MQDLQNTSMMQESMSTTGMSSSLHNCFFTLHCMPWWEGLLPHLGLLKNTKRRWRLESTISITSSIRPYFMLWSVASSVKIFNFLTSLYIDPFVLYYGGYRYNQPNHLYHMLMLSHATAYFIFDSIIEIAYKTDDFLTNSHHVSVLMVSYFCLRAPHTGFEYICKTTSY